MVKLKQKTFVVLEVPVQVTDKDIEEGKCGDINRCMEKLALHRDLTKALGDGVDRVRIDGSQIKWNFGGYRWYATTPKKPKLALIAFDRKRPVRPHSYTITAFRGTKIAKVEPERQAQINRARQARVEAGTPDKKRHGRSLHQRVVGLGAV